MPQISLQKIKGHSSYTPGIFSAGVYLQGDTCVLIDSGSDQTSAKAIYETVQTQSKTVTAIVNTHCHPDHCGGNYFFQTNFPRLRVFAAQDEKEFIENPTLAARCFCGGAAPFSGLRNKHIAPQKESKVTDPILNSDNAIVIDAEVFKIIPLPGHTPGSIGIITPDNILYCGDALFGSEVIKKHPILFYTDIQNTLASLKKLTSLQVDGCVLYHGGFIESLAEAIEQHVTLILETKNHIVSILKNGPLSVDALTQRIMQHYKIPNSIIAFTLTQTTLRAYLTCLEYEKGIELIVRDGLLQAATLS